MINVEVATHLASLDVQVDDIRKLLIIESTLLFLTFLCSLWGPWWGATLFALLSAIMLVPFADYFKRWEHNLRQLLNATRNIRTGSLDLL